MHENGTSERRKHISSVARRLFNTKGFAATSMRDLAQEVGIKAASLYNHVAAKEDLLNEICFEMADAFFAGFQEATVSEKSIARKLQQAIKAHIKVIEDHPDASKVFFEEWIFLKEEDLLRFKKLRSQYEKGFRLLLEKGIETNELRKTNVRLTTFMILSSLNAIYDLERMKERLSSHEVAEEICSLLMKGMKR
ncbi:MAG: TetR/AcrR family transcriptional regulator [Chitinophagales bacterium]